MIRYVAGLVAAGRAQCVLGNHELNLLRGSPKPANGWFFATDHDRAQGKFLGCQPATATEREIFPGFLRRPAAGPGARRTCGSSTRPGMRNRSQTWAGNFRGHPVLEVYRQHAAASERWASAGARHGEREAGIPGLGAVPDRRGQSRSRCSRAIGTLDEHFQMSNPVRVLTSGVERLASTTFFASGKWRMVNRVAWWQDYQDDVPVLFGHYWRWASPDSAALYSRGERDLFAGVAPNHGLVPGATPSAWTSRWACATGNAPCRSRPILPGPPRCRPLAGAGAGLRRRRAAAVSQSSRRLK